jgi:hypothetical protein
MRPGHTGRWSAGALGVLGSIACTASMIAAAAGVGGAAAATSMAGMTNTGTGHPGGALGALVRIGPWLIVLSALLVTAAFALTRRPLTAIPALAAGAVLYAGMYAQNSLPVMYASVAVGYLTWAALALWAARPWHAPTAQRTPTTLAAAPAPAAHDFTTNE